MAIQKRSEKGSHDRERGDREEQVEGHPAPSSRLGHREEEGPRKCEGNESVPGRAGGLVQEHAAELGGGGVGPPALDRPPEGDRDQGLLVAVAARPVGGCLLHEQASLMPAARAPASRGPNGFDNRFQLG
jgi:hypothetical protein